MTSPHEQALTAAVEALCQASLFDGDGHGCGGCCQAKVRFGKEAEATVRAYLAALRASDLAEWEKAAEGVTPGPWQVYDGCSWRRIGTAQSVGRHDDCAVLAPTKASDGHPDLTCSRGNDREANLAWIARCSPDNVLSAFRSLSAKLTEARDQRDYWRGRDKAGTEIETELRCALEAAEARVKALTERLAEMEAALEPFSDMAGELFARNWNTSDVVIALDNPCDPHRVTAGDFFAARRARKETPDAQ